MASSRILLIICSLMILISCNSSHEKAIELIKKGNEFERNSAFTEAQKSYQKAIKADPENAVAWFFMGNVKRNQGMIRESLADYDKAIELDSTFADAYANRGDARFSLNDRDGSCKDYLKAEALGKENMHEKTKWCK